MSVRFLGKWFRPAAAAVAMLTVGGIASAQSPFPSKPVHIFVPYAAGGGVDILARTLGDVVSRQWGQTVVVENRPGAGGVVASQALVTLRALAVTTAARASFLPNVPSMAETVPGYDTEVWWVCSDRPACLATSPSKSPTISWRLSTLKR